MAAQDAGYGGTHYALALVADHDGDLDRARSEFAQAQRLWQHADPNVAELMRIRAWRVSHDGAVR